METTVEYFQKEHFTTDDAVVVINELINKYEAIIGRIIKIKQEMPEEGSEFRRRSQNTDLLQQLQSILLILRQKIADIEQQLHAPENGGGSVKTDNPRLNQTILDVLVDAVEQCHRAYANQSKSFAVLLQELERLLVQFQRKADIVAKTEAEASLSLAQQHVTGSEGSEEILVYVRVFHRRMLTLLEAKESLSWLKAVLDAVKTAEKHGLAVYENEDEVKFSLKNECYAYATLRIKSQQNITAQRPPKVDSASGVQLLTITPVDVDNLLKLTYAGRDYVIKDGVVIRPKT